MGHARGFNWFMKDYHNFPEPQQKLLCRQNYPIVRNRDGYDRYLFFNRQAEGAIFEARHFRRPFSDNPSLRVEDQTLAIVDRLSRLDEHVVFAFEAGPVDSDVEFAVHKS